MGEFMKSKCMGNLSVEYWFLTSQNTSKNSSIIWKVLVYAFPLVGKCTVWRIGNGKKIWIGQDL
jgi:hypothetical protein